ncbi:Protocadherin gamma-B4 [Schistosoma japonicum]|nr:Protocadherin gamma-B4 [Schistosoma japonicum]
MASSLEYQIMSSTFHIESDGHVRLRSSLDYELRHIYSIPVEVTDGEFSARNTLNVQVLDVNDEPPAFELNPKQLVAEENAPAGKLIGRVRIRDPDSPSVNGLVRCSEPPGLVRRQALHFLPDPTVNPTAEVYDLTTRIVLDREDPENPIPGHLIIYLICSDGASGAGGVASDNFDDRVRLTSTMTTTLIIRDVNDHKPIFEKSVYHVSIQENNPIGEKVVQKFKAIHIVTERSIQKNTVNSVSDFEASRIILTLYYLSSVLDTIEDKPASGGLGQSSLSSSYYMSNISGLGLDGWGPGSEKNILIITILSVVSGILVAILISAVFCVTKPCSSNRHGNRCVNGRHDRLRNRPPTYPGGPDSNNGILMNENGAFINGTVEQRGYPLSNGSQPTTFNRPPGPLNGDLYMDNWIHHVRDSEASYGNMTFPLSCPSGDSEQDISNDQHILINPRFKSQKENHFNYVNGQPSQVIYENLERCHLHDTDLSSDLTTTRMSFSSRNNDHPVAIRVLSPQIGVDGVSGVHDQIFLPRSNKLSGISIGHSIDSIIPTSNSALPPLSMKMDTANAFCVSKPIPVLSKTIYSFSEYQMV